MKKKKSEPKELQPWERRPWPASGDAHIADTYTGVGRTLSQWERYEGTLSLLFSALVSGMTGNAAYRAYSAVRTFEARTEMLRAASESYFAENPDPENLELFKTVIRDAKCYGPRRNDIAHGVVDYFQLFPVTLPLKTSKSFCLYPSYASFKERDIKHMPMYCYTSVELNYFCDQFQKISEPAATIAGHLLLKSQHESFVKKGL